MAPSDKTVPPVVALRGAAPWSAARVRNELKTRFFKTTTLRDHADANANPDPAPVAPRRVYLPTASRSQLITIRRWTAVRACFCTSGSECLRIDITYRGRSGA